MAFIQAQFGSNQIGKAVSLYACVPEMNRGPYPVYYLLHGLSDDHTIWQRRTRIEYYCRDLPLIVVMPDGFRGYYTDNAEGPPYGKYLTEDVINFAERTFPALGTREGRCIGGLSMGGYGALRYALDRPDLFISANSHSGATFNWASDMSRASHAEGKRIFGANPLKTRHDIYHMASEVKAAATKGGPLPKLRIDCGTEDFLYNCNVEFHQHLDQIGYPHEYLEFPGFHDWDYWDIHIKGALAFHLRHLNLDVPAYLK